MDKKVKNVILFLCAYLLVFWIGFKSGAIYVRMRHKVQVEKIEVPAAPTPISYYIIEKNNYGSYSSVNYIEAGEDHTMIKMLKNEKLRPLLKVRDIEIYKADGERVY